MTQIDNKVVRNDYKSKPIWKWEKNSNEIVRKFDPLQRKKIEKGASLA